MSLYLTLKWLHILSSVLMVGTGFGSAYYMFSANRSGNIAAQAVVARLVVRADWWFTTPTAIVQPATGLAMAWLAGIPLTTPWLAASIALFVFAGACWLPVLWLQVRMNRLVQEAVRSGQGLPAVYRRYVRWWEWLGYPAFVAMLVIFYLMVNKPALQFGLP
ncbi:MAG: hypothetical protein JWQ72_3121 [Polaromonas sp.]|nr:hypothetical protein [Polaromonas sp.]